MFSGKFLFSVRQSVNPLINTKPIGLLKSIKNVTPTVIAFTANIQNQRFHYTTRYLGVQLKINTTREQFCRYYGSKFVSELTRQCSPMDDITLLELLFSRILPTNLILMGIRMMKSKN